MPDKTSAITLSDAQVEKLCQRILWSLADADNALSTYRETIKTLRELFNPRPRRPAYKSGEPGAAPWPGACELHVGMCEWTVQKDKAEVNNAIFSVSPLYKYEAKTEADTDDASAVERYIEELIVHYMKAVETLLSACEGGFREGSQGVYIRWSKLVRDRTTFETVEKTVTDSDGQPLYHPDVYLHPATMWIDGVPHLPSQDELGTPTPIAPLTELSQEPITKPQVIYDGPQFELIDITRMGTYPAANSNLNLSPLAYVRFSQSWDAILQGVEEGQYDKGAVKKLLHKTGADADTDYLVTPEDEQRGIAPTAGVSGTKQWEPVDLTACWLGYVKLPESGTPSTEHTDLQRTQEYLVILCEKDEIVLAAHPMEDWSGERPIKVIMPRGSRYGIYGISDPDLAGDIQGTMTQQVRNMFDKQDYDLRRPMAASPDALVGKELSDFMDQNKPGGFFVLEDPTKLIYPANPSAPAGSEIPLLNWAQDLSQRAGAASDASLGVMAGGRRTRGEVEITTARGDLPTQMIIRHIARDLVAIAQVVQHLAYQHIANDSMQRLWAQVNPDKMPPEGSPYWPGQQELSKEYEVACWGVAEDANRAMNRQKWATFGLEMMQDPDVQEDPETAYAAKSDRYNGLGFISKRYLGDETSFVNRRREREQRVAAAMAAQQNAAAAAQAGQQQTALAGEQQKAAAAERQHQQELERIAFQGEVHRALQPPPQEQPVG